MLATAPDIKCLYVVDSGEEAIKRIPKYAPDVILMDIQLPGVSGIECVAALKPLLPATEIVMLTIYEDSESIFRALKAGAQWVSDQIKSARKVVPGNPRRVFGRGAFFDAHRPEK